MADMKTFIAKAFATAAAAASIPLFAAQEKSPAGEPLKVLMIGNSFSISCMSHLPSVARELGKPLDVASLYIGGCPMKRHWRNIEAAASNAAFRPYRYDRDTCGKKVADNESRNIPDALAEAKWDIVTVQQASGDSWNESTYHPWGDRLVEYIRKNAPQAKIVVQETWSYTPWDKRLAKWGMTQDEMYEKLHAAYASFAAKHSLEIIPMGTAVQKWRKRLPVEYAENSLGGDVVGGKGKPPEKRFKRGADGKWIPACDVFHLGDSGEYFQALVWAAALFKDADIGKVAKRPKCTTAREARLMREIAAGR